MPPDNPSSWRWWQTKSNAVAAFHAAGPSRFSLRTVESQLAF
jgi:hypothetical protein